MRGQGSLIRKHIKGCTKIRCSCPWAVRFRDGEVNRSKSFSSKKSAMDFQAQLLRDKRAGEEIFISKGEVPFIEYAAEWIERGQSRNERTKITCNRVPDVHYCKCGGEDNLPTDRSLLFEGYDEYTREKMGNATTQPSMADVITAQNETMRRAAEDRNHRDHVEDLRGVKIPRNERVPEYKRTQDIRELLRP